MKRRASVGTFASLVFLGLIGAGPAYAYTECSGLMLTRIYTDVGGNFFISTGGYLNGYIPASADIYKAAMAVALAARASGMPVTIRYARTGVVCGSAPWDEIISGIGM